MTSLASNKANTNNFSISLIIFVLIGILLLIFDLLGLFGPIIDSYSFLTREFKVNIVSQANSYERLWKSFSRFEEISIENQNLIEENQLLTSQVGRLEQAFIENQQLKDQLGIDYEREYEKIGVYILGFTDSTNSSVRLNKGNADGIDEGDILVIENIAIGRIVEVENFSSVVSLLNSGETSIPVKTNRQNIGILRADGTGDLIITDVLQSTQINEDEIILTSGLADNYPPNLVIGKVANISEDLRESTKKVSVEPSVQYNTLERAIVLSLPI